MVGKSMYGNASAEVLRPYPSGPVAPLGAAEAGTMRSHASPSTPGKFSLYAVCLGIYTLTLLSVILLFVFALALRGVSLGLAIASASAASVLARDITRSVLNGASGWAGTGDQPHPEAHALDDEAGEDDAR